MKNNNRTLILVGLLTLNFFSGFAQGVSTLRRDHLFPAHGNSMVTIATGIPYVAAAEYSYGFSDRFSVGVMAAAAPPASAYGIRLRWLISENNNGFRLEFRTPVLYYPPHPDLFCGEPWMLAWPVVSAEWTLQSGTRLSVGGGVVGAACVHSLMGHSKGGEKFMGGIWNTVHAGVAFPVNNNLMFQAEASAVMSGTRIAGPDWIAKFPAIVVLGLSYSIF